MNRNVGKVDKIIRIIVGLIIIAVGVIYNSWFAIIGFVPLLTAVIGWCPLYCPLKINTTCDKESCKKENADQE